MNGDRGGETELGYEKTHSCGTKATAPFTAEPSVSRMTLAGEASSPFHEYFYGDDGAGLGASHQTGGPRWSRN
jgi:hypothetical protein